MDRLAEIGVCALAQRNLDDALDAPVEVKAATIPLQMAEFVDALDGAKSFQIVSTETGLLLIAWRRDGSYRVFDVIDQAVPVPL